MNATQDMLARSAKTRHQPKVGGMTRGRETQLNDPYDDTRTIAEAIIDYVRNDGLKPETATSAAGLSVNALRNWYNIAGKATIRQTADPTTQLTSYEEQCRDLVTKVTSASAEWEQAENARLTGAEEGGHTARVVREVRKFKGPNDKEGWVAQRTTELKSIPPDPRVTMWRLEKRFPSEYGNKVAISVEDLALSDEEKAESLAEQLSAYLEGRDDGVAEGSPESVPEAVEQAETQS